MENLVVFKLGDMIFEYDDEKNQKNIKKHHISFKTAARVFFDYDRLEFYDEENSSNEDRYDIIGSVSNNISQTIGHCFNEDVLFVVYTERIKSNGLNVTRIISARYATLFERRLYYDK